MEGFLLDRGFQIFLTSYPEAQVGAAPGCCLTDVLTAALSDRVLYAPPDQLT